VPDGPRRSDLDAVTLDAYETLVYLDDPVPALRDALRRELGVAVEPDRCRRALVIEMRHYAASCHRAHDAASLAAVRSECAALLAAELALPGVGGADVLPALRDALAFRAYPDARATIDRLLESGLAVGVVSNWDVSLHDELERSGLSRGIEVVVTSAESGFQKPDPAIYRSALDRLGVAPARALHVGDSAAGDVDGARAAGMHAVHLDRRTTPPERTPRIRTLLELPALLDLDAGV
jgi:putative hydrolase of the HAD superfamily